MKLCASFSLLCISMSYTCKPGKSTFCIMALCQAVWILLILLCAFGTGDSIFHARPGLGDGRCSPHGEDQAVRSVHCNTYVFTSKPIHLQNQVVILVFRSLVAATSPSRNPPSRLPPVDLHTVLPSTYHKGITVENA